MAHPDVPQAWRKGTRDKRNHKKDAVARKAAGVTGHMLRRKAGSYGAHDVVMYRVPFLNAAGKKLRKASVAYICKRCTAYSWC